MELGPKQLLWAEYLEGKEFEGAPVKQAQGRLQRQNLDGTVSDCCLGVAERCVLGNTPRLVCVKTLEDPVFLFWRLDVTDAEKDGMAAQNNTIGTDGDFMVNWDAMALHDSHGEFRCDPHSQIKNADRLMMCEIRQFVLLESGLSGKQRDDLGMATSLADLNDAGVSFAVIAKVIRKFPHYLFTASV